MKQLSEQELQLLRKKPDFYMTDEELALFDDDEKWQSEERDYYGSDEYTESREYEEDFYARYPDCPRPKHLYRLDWVISKLRAQAIVNGRRENLAEPYLPELEAKLIDPDTERFRDWAVENKDEEAVNAYKLVYDEDIRVETIHFHDEANTWYLDVECDGNGTIHATSEDVEDSEISDLYGIVRILDKAHVSFENRPRFFYFVLGDIISTNLKKANDPNNKPVPDNEPDHLKAWMKQWL